VVVAEVWSKQAMKPHLLVTRVWSEVTAQVPPNPGEPVLPAFRHVHIRPHVVPQCSVQPATSVSFWNGEAFPGSVGCCLYSLRTCLLHPLHHLVQACVFPVEVFDLWTGNLSGKALMNTNCMGCHNCPLSSPLLQLTCALC